MAQFFGDLFNYLSTLSIVTFLVALLMITPLGIFLCRYNMKFVAISIIGLGWVTVYLAQSTIVVVNLLENTGRSSACFLLQYVLPPVFFVMVATGAIRYGLKVWTKRQGRPRQHTRPYVFSESPRFRQRCSAFLYWFTTKGGIAVCAIAAAVLTLHLLNMANPPYYICDEGYYVTEANQFLHGRVMIHPEHPPLGKWLIASGIFIFGDNAVGWRAFSILFGVAAIFIFYFICGRVVRQELGSARPVELSPPVRGRAKWFQATTFVPVLATFLFASENMSFVQAHVAMLDVFYVTFMLLGFLLYLRGNYLSCGVVMGLSMLCKSVALLGILAIVLHWAVTRRSELAAEIRYMWNVLQGRKATAAPRSEILSVFKLLVAVAVVWSVLLILLEYPAIHHYPVTTQWANPIVRTVYMLWHHLALTSGALGGFLVATKPWLWPVWPSVIYHFPGSYGPRYLASIGWTVWAVIIPSTAYLIYEVVKHRAKRHDVAMFLLCWISGVYGLLIVMALISDRLMYHFYFYPAIPVVCLAIAWGMWKLWGAAERGPKTRVAFLACMATYLLGTVATFIIMSPLGTNLVKLPF